MVIAHVYVQMGWVMFSKIFPDSCSNGFPTNTISPWSDFFIMNTYTYSDRNFNDTKRSVCTTRINVQCFSLTRNFIYGAVYQ